MFTCVCNTLCNALLLCHPTKQTKLNCFLADYRLLYRPNIYAFRPNKPECNNNYSCVLINYAIIHIVLQ